MLGHSLASIDAIPEGYQFGLLLPEVVMTIWNDVEQILNEHVPEEGCELFAAPVHIKQSIMDASAFVWAGFQDRELELVAICCFRRYPLTRTMEVIYVGGKGLRKAFRHWPKMEEWAAKCGATHVEARISPAMKRFYKPLGVEEVALYYRKPLLAFAN